MLRPFDRLSWTLGVALATVACAPAPAAGPATEASPAATSPAAQAKAQALADWSGPLPKPSQAIALPMDAGAKLANATWQMTRLDNGKELLSGQTDGQGRFTPVVPPELATVPVKLVAAGGGLASGNAILGGAVGAVLSANGAWLQSANVLSAGGASVISAGGGAVISAGGGAVISAGGGAVISAGGGALQAFGLLASRGGRYRLAQAPDLNQLLQGPIPPVGLTPGALLANLALADAQRFLAQQGPNTPALALAAAEQLQQQLGQSFAQNLATQPNPEALVFQANENPDAPLPGPLGELVQQQQGLIDQANRVTDLASVFAGQQQGQPVTSFPPRVFNGQPQLTTPPAELATALQQLNLPPLPPPGPAPEGPLGPVPGQPLPPGAPPLGPELPGPVPPGPVAPPAPDLGGGGGGGSTVIDPVPFVPAASPGVALGGPFAAPTRVTGTFSSSLAGPEVVGFGLLSGPHLPIGKGRALVLQHGAMPDRSLFVLANVATVGLGVPVWRAPLLPQGNLGPFSLAGYAPSACARGVFVGAGPSANVIGASATSAQYHAATVDNFGAITFTTPGTAMLNTPVANPACAFADGALIVAGGQDAGGNDVANLQRIPLLGSSPASDPAASVGALPLAASGGQLVAGPGYLAWANPASVGNAPTNLSFTLQPNLGNGLIDAFAGPLRASQGTDAVLLSEGSARFILLAGGASGAPPELMSLPDLPASMATVPAPSLRYLYNRQGGTLASFGPFAYLVGGLSQGLANREIGGVEFARLLP